MSDDSAILTEMRAQLEAMSARLKEVEADRDAAKAAADQIPHCAPGVTMDSGRPKPPCMRCGNWHKLGDCMICSECRQQNGVRYLTPRPGSECPKCGSLGVSDLRHPGALRHPGGR